VNAGWWDTTLDWFSAAGIHAALVLGTVLIASEQGPIASSDEIGFIGCGFKDQKVLFDSVMLPPEVLEWERDADWGPLPVVDHATWAESSPGVPFERTPPSLSVPFRLGYEPGTRGYEEEGRR